MQFYEILTRHLINQYILIFYFLYPSSMNSLLSPCSEIAILDPTGPRYYHVCPEENKLNLNNIFGSTLHHSQSCIIGTTPTKCFLASEIVPCVLKPLCTSARGVHGICRSASLLAAVQQACTASVGQHVSWQQCRTRALHLSVSTSLGSSAVGVHGLDRSARPSAAVHVGVHGLHRSSRLLAAVPWACMASIGYHVSWQQCSRSAWHPSVITSPGSSAVGVHGLHRPARLLAAVQQECMASIGRNVSWQQCSRSACPPSVSTSLGSSAVGVHGLHRSSRLLPAVQCACMASIGQHVSWQQCRGRSDVGSPLENLCG